MATLSIIPKEPKRALLLLHGFGSNGDDLLSLVPLIEERLPEEARGQTAYFSPNGFLTLPFGGYAWFSDANWTFRDREGIESAKDKLWQYIEEHIFSLGLTASDLTVLGFSQGAMTSFFSTPRWIEPVRHLIAHSGRLLWEEELEGTDFHKVPTLILHGTEDDVVPSEEAQNAAHGLQELNFPVTQHLIPNLGHGINEESLKHIVEALS